LINGMVHLVHIDVLILDHVGYYIEQLKQEVTLIIAIQ